VRGSRTQHRTLIDKNGNPTAAGIFYFATTNREPPNRKFDTQQEPARARYGRREEIQLRDGSRATVRTYNARTGAWRLTALGKSFYAHRPTMWTVQIPVRQMLPRKNGTYYAKETWLPGSAVAELGSLSFSSDVPEAQQRAEVRARVAAWLATKTETMDGATILLDSSYDPQPLDTGRDFEYSKEETFLEDGAARVSAVLNRPLRTPNPFVWGDMYKAEGLAREAFEGEGNCVVRQLEALAYVSSNGQRVSAWSHEQLERELDRAKAELYTGEDSPYFDDDGAPLDWRDVGVTGAMLAEICRRRHIPLNILWGNHVVERVAFDACGNGTSRLACHIRGDHAYFYGDPMVRRDIAKLPVSIPQAAQPATLKVRARAGDEGSIEDWTPLDAFEPGLEGHFYVVGGAAMLEARKRMHELRICPRVSLSGPCTQDVSKLTVRERGRKDFVLHRVHPEHLACQAFLTHFAEQTGTEPLSYHGESLGAVLSAAFEVLAKSGKVRDVNQATRAEIFTAQTGLCADCGDRLARFEVDHRTQLFLGGSNDRDNLAAVCLLCHRAKCLGESVSGECARAPSFLCPGRHSAHTRGCAGRLQLRAQGPRVRRAGPENSPLSRCRLVLAGRVRVDA
jgi:hypothetical protein